MKQLVYLLWANYLLLGCKATPEVTPIINTTVVSADQASLVLTATKKQTLDLFELTTFRVSNLTAGQRYRFKLRFVYNHRDTLTTERTYVHQPNTFWKRLAHAAIDGGDFTGSLIGNGDLSALETNFLTASRYVLDEQGQTWYYQLMTDQWFSATANNLIPHNYIEFRLQAVPGITYLFKGLGYLDNDRVPGNRIYLKTMVAYGIGGGPVHPDYAGADGEVAFFTTVDRAFQLTQQGSRELWVRRGNWAQYQGHDFPEAPGTLATFTIDGIGYVINQLEGQTPRLYAYQPDQDQWTRKADFPGSPRSRGVGFAVSGKGYFGLGITGDDEWGLRDLWQYDPIADQWQYVTEYPGQASRYLIISSLLNRVYLGWGYESQAAPSGGSRVVGCTDLWEFKP